MLCSLEDNVHGQLMTNVTKANITIWYGIQLGMNKYRYLTNTCGAASMELSYLPVNHKMLISIMFGQMG